MYKVTIMVEDSEKDQILKGLDDVLYGMWGLGFKMPRTTTEYVHEEPTNT